jgi:SAM-dependent methyltransferase
MHRILSGLSCCSLVLFAMGQSPMSPVEYEWRSGSPDGIGKWYMGREISHTMDAAHAAWLDRPEREREEQPARMLARMNVAPTDVIADIGCGTGQHAIPLALLAREGKVYAVDIQRAMLDSVFARSLLAGCDNVEPKLGSTTSPDLAPDLLDKVLMVDVYHEFDHPREMMEGIVRAMKPGALLFLVEFRGEDERVPIKPLHRMTKAQAIKEMQAAGLVHDRTWNGLPWQHFLVFRKPVA